MAEKKYESARPPIPAELQRMVKVEAGHNCAVARCPEHTYLEIHHIDENRENNTLPNLILLCDKHHKMAHDGHIDRKALREYKKPLSDTRDASIGERLDALEKAISEAKAEQPVSKPTDDQPVDAETKKLAPPRYSVLQFALTQVAICHYEKSHNIYFEHQVELVRGESRLVLDALRQDNDLAADIILDVYYIRKSYLDSPAYGPWLEQKIELYELLTGRKARGVIVAVVSKDRMKEGDALPFIKEGLKACQADIQLEIYSCSDIGFHPGAVSTALFQSNL